MQKFFSTSRPGTSIPVLYCWQCIIGGEHIWRALIAQGWPISMPFAFFDPLWPTKWRQVAMFLSIPLGKLTVVRYLKLGQPLPIGCCTKIRKIARDTSLQGWEHYLSLQWSRAFKLTCLGFQWGQKYVNSCMRWSRTLPTLFGCSCAWAWESWHASRLYERRGRCKQQGRRNV